MMERGRRQQTIHYRQRRSFAFRFRGKQTPSVGSG
jgi:hypothetical protein